MRIVELGASDPRFRTLRFHEGNQLNLIVAEKTRPPGVGDTRNGTGKTEAANILRYLLGGNRPSTMTGVDSLEHFEFYGRFLLTSLDAGQEIITVKRALKSTKVSIEGWSRAPEEPISAKEWAQLLGQHVFRLPADLTRPTVSQLFGQFLRANFAPTKIHPSEADWEAGCRYAFLFGLDAGVAAGAGEVARLTQQQKALNQAAKDGALADLKLDVPSLRGRLVAARRERESANKILRDFRVEERYAEHQDRANILSSQILIFNERDLVLRRSLADLDRAVIEESEATDADRLISAAAKLYAEIGIAFSDVAIRRFDDVKKFHASVIENRRMFLENQRAEVSAELLAVRNSRSRLDEERAVVLRLLEDSVALTTYHEAQSSLAGLDAEIAGIQDRLEIAENLDNLGAVRDEKAVDSRRKMRLEIHEQESRLDEARGLFSDLTAEIYGHGTGRTRAASLDLGVAQKSGGFLVEPKIASDGSAGIASVETWVLDMVSICMAVKNGHSPGFIFHDSALFDAVDSEQVASCLNIGARLAESEGFQYVVSINSDALAAARSEAQGAFDEDPYLLQTRLSDATDDLRLFGFLYG